MRKKYELFGGLPEVAAEYIWSVARRVGNTRRVRREVVQELCDHFRDALRDCTDEAARAERAKALIEQFGDVKTLGRLIRRGKKRCRPLWRKTLARGFQAVGVLFMVYIALTAWIWTASPTPSIDYFADFLAHARPKMPPDQNAWLLYEKARKLYVDPLEELKDIALRANEYQDKRFEELTAEQQAGLRKWIADNEPAWRQMEEGARKPYFWIGYSYEKDQAMIELRLPSLSHLRSLAKMGFWQTSIAANEGRTQDALNYSLVVAKVGRHCQACRGTLIEQLVGMAISGYACENITLTAASPNITASQLADVQRQMEAMYANGYPEINIYIEQLTFLDIVQRSFTEGGPGGGRLIPKTLLPLVGGSEDEAVADIRLVLGTLYFAGRDENVALGSEYYERMQTVLVRTPYEIKTQNLWRWHDDFIDRYVITKTPRYPLISIIAPSLQLAGVLAFEQKAKHEGTIAVLALRRWRLVKGSYPESLGDLVEAGYLNAVPDDPFGPGSLTYARRGEGFILYSLGRDCEDDGGRRTTKAMRKLNNIADRVIWPLRSEK